MTPVYEGLELAWVLFAGVRTAGADLGSIHREPLTRWKRPPWDGRTPMPPPVGREEADLIHEHLLQLAARLRNWAQQRSRQLPANRQPVEAMGNSLLIRRRTLIRRYIESNQSHPIRLRDLAAELKVSEDRATHLIRECCGQTYREMLIDARLKTARELLRLSSLPILEVALCSGFTEISHFNRLFRQRLGCAPGQYRRTPPATG
jgi:AraC-like DNA-binding protein